VTSAVQPGWHIRAYRGNWPFQSVPHFLTRNQNFVHFQATVVPLPGRVPTPASAGTATPNPFTGNPFVRQAASPGALFLRNLTPNPRPPSSTTSISTMILSLHPMLPCLARWQHTSAAINYTLPRTSSLFRYRKTAASEYCPDERRSRTSLSEAEAYRGWERLRGTFI
jgi:hypothetical protein